MQKFITCLLITLVFTQVSAKTKDCPSPNLDSSPKELLNFGYCDKYGYFYPSLITVDAARRALPDYAEGVVTWVNPNRMEDTALVNNINLSNYIDGIALMSCADIGQTVWIKRPEADWEGPYVVADCANPKHMFAAICYKEEITELGFKTAQAWGLATYDNEKVKVVKHVVAGVQIMKSTGFPEPNGEPVDYRTWWLSKLTFVNGESYPEMNFDCSQ